MGHNQERYIAPCIESILNQRYEHPLEIILCDDCSEDRTYEIMEQMAASYAGPHLIQTHRSPVNMKVAANMNTAVSLSHGEWLMRVDGDDILHPDRVRLTAMAILRHPEATAISGKLIPFSETPQPIENPPDPDIRYRVADKHSFSHGKKPAWLEWWGCMMTLHRKIFTVFGEIPPACGIMDDTFFATRALMLGEFVTIDNGILLYYRRHGGNISSARGGKNTLLSLIREDADTRDYYQRCLPCHRPILEEIERHTATHPNCQDLLAYFRSHMEELERQATFWQRSWKSRLADAAIQGAWWRKIPRALRVSSPLAWALARRLGL